MQELRGRVCDGRTWASRLRRAADRKFDWWQHSPQLRSADREPPPDRRGSGSAGGALLAGASRDVDGGHQEDLLSPAGAGAVRAVSADVEWCRNRRDLRHGRERQDGCRWKARRHGSDRLRPRRRDLRSGPARLVHPGFRRQHHPLHRHRPPAAL